MEGRRSFVSSRSFANDQRPVPNIVAIYERPRHKIRRDSTHVLGGMFGWNTQEEVTRAMRSEVARAEEEVAVTPDSATPVDATLAGPSQRCGKRPMKRSKRRAFAPLVDMGTSILSLHFQELMRRRQEDGEKQEQTPVAPPAKRPLVSLEDVPVVSVASPSTPQARASPSAGDLPTTKKLRLTINTVPPPIDTSIPTTLPSAFLQMPPSPPDTSSNASKAPAEEPVSAPNFTSTPKAALPQSMDLNPFEFDTLALFPPESDSESESTSESSSELDSDSPDLSSSTSTRSATQNKGKQKQEEDIPNSTIDASEMFSVPSTSIRGPSTPPRRKRPTHKPGWIGWVQTEESPDHSRLIRLDDAPVILGRRTRSGKEFKDPPPPPPSRRKSIVEKPKQEQLPRKERPRPKPTRKAKKPEVPTGEKSKHQSAWQEAQRRAANGGGTDRASTPTAVPEPDAETPTKEEADEEKAVEQELSAEKSLEGQAGVEDTDATTGRPDDPSGKDLAHRKSMTTPKSGASKSSTGTTNERNRDSHSTAPRASKSSPSALKEPTGTEDSTQIPTPKSAVAMSKSAVSKNSTIVANKSLATETPVREEGSVGLPRASVTTKDKATSLKGGLKPTLTKSPSTGQIEKSTSSLQSNPRRDTFASWLPKKKPQPRPVQSGTNGTGETSAASSSKPYDGNRKLAGIAGLSGNKAILGKGAFPMSKRKEPPESLSGADTKKRKLVRETPSSSGESPEPRGFTVHPFDIRAKRAELSRNGVMGESLKNEMKKWVGSQRKEWKQKEKEKSSGEGEKSGSDARSAGARTIVSAFKSSKGDDSAPGATDHATSKSVKGSKGPWNSFQIGSKAKESSSAIRDPQKTIKDSSQSDNPGSSPKAQTAPSQRVWNSDLGMEVAKVSVTGPGDAKPKPKKLFDRREGDSTQRRLTINGSSTTLGSSSFFSRGPKPKPRVAP